jgi:hypothetical protein
MKQGMAVRKHELKSRWMQEVAGMDERISVRTEKEMI